MMKVLLALALVALTLPTQARHLAYDLDNPDDVMSLLSSRALETEDLDELREVDEMRRQLKPYLKGSEAGLRYRWNGGRTSIGAGTRLGLPYNPNVRVGFEHRFRNGGRLNIGGGYNHGSRHWNVGATYTIPFGR